MLRRRLIFVTATAAVAATLSAGGCSSGPAQGAQGGACFPNMTCNSGLACIANVCQSAEAGMMDSGAMDTGKDTYRPDTGADSGIECPNPKGDLTGFTAPMGVVMPNPPQDTCTALQITSYWTACRDAMATQMTCSAWRTANTACGKCIESNDTDTSWGVLVYGSGAFIPSGIVQANYDGCLVLEGAAQCGNDDFAAGQCNKFACEEQCPVSDNTSYQQYSKCTTTASTGVCKMYSQKASTSCSGDAGAAIAACKGTSFQDYYNKLAAIFCSAGG